ncbi:MAG: hypothetical protein WA364_30910 [Candidatus Nitrosopolaris sp.]
MLQGNINRINSIVAIAFIVILFGSGVVAETALGRVSPTGSFGHPIIPLKLWTVESSLTNNSQRADGARDNMTRDISDNASNTTNAGNMPNRMKGTASGVISTNFNPYTNVNVHGINLSSTICKIFISDLRFLIFYSLIHI